jgi:hypothetical protein
MSLPVLLSRLSSKDIVICLDFFIMMVEISIGYYVIVFEIGIYLLLNLFFVLLSLRSLIRSVIMVILKRVISDNIEVSQ